MDERKKALLSWLDELEQYAKGNSLPGRIMDGIQECKRRLSSDNLEPDKLRPEVEGILDSIRKKTVPKSVREGEVDSHVTAQDVRQQIQKMAQRCHDENEMAIQNLSELKNLALKKCEAQLKDILYVDAHMEEITDGARYIQFYEKAAVGLEKETSNILSELFGAMDENYTHMLEHMRSFLGSIRANGNDTVRENMLYEVEAKREGIGKRILAEAETWKTGRQEIVSFAQRTGAQISKIVKKIEFRRKLYVVIPALIVLLLGVGNHILGAVKPEADAGTGEEFILTIMENVVDLTFVVGILLIGIAGIMIVVLLYKAYLKRSKSCCNRSIAKKSVEYLQKEFVRFEQSNCLRFALDESIKMAVEEYEQRHVRLFNEAFAFGDSGQEEQQKSRFDELITAWNSIR